jgi:hypothetical protein
MTTDVVLDNSDYPANVSLDRSPTNSRLFALLYLVGLKHLLGFPHGVILVVYGLAALILGWIAQWIVLFTGSYPRGFIEFMRGYFQWSFRLNTWIYGLTDRYPPFTHEDAAVFAAQAEASVAASSSRLLAVARILGIQFLLLIPHLVALVVLAMLQGLMVFISAIAIIFTGRYPEAFFDIVLGVERWIFRVNVYALGLVDRYPPFRMVV